MNKILLKAKNIKKEFGGIIAVKDCSFDIEEQKITALIGPNGAGKTTMFNILTGYIKPTNGTVLFAEKEIEKRRPDIIAQQGLSRTFQQIKIFPKMTILENMLVAMESYEEAWHRFLQPKKTKQKEEENKEKVRELLKFINLETKENEYAGNISYGQQKLLEIVQACAMEPKILLLDEPTAGVNLTMLNTIKKLILTLKKQGMTILFIEHNMEFVMDIADTIIVMDYGEEIAVGTPEHIKKNKKVIAAYLGT